MRVIAVLAVAGLIALVIALLLRDWHGEGIGNVPSDSRQPSHEPPVIEACESSLTADDFSPDLSTDPDGPSSDARADQF